MVTAARASSRRFYWCIGRGGVVEVLGGLLALVLRWVRSRNVYVMVCRVSSKDQADRAGRAKERDEGTSQCISYTAGCGSRAAALRPTYRDLHPRL